jgi:hypothetical protein
MNRKTIVFCVFLAVVLTVPAFPLMLRLSLQELTGNAEIIAAGKVVERECRWGERGKWIYSYVTVSVDEYIKGSGDEQVVVRHLGGEVGEKGLIVGNMPRFSEGEEVLVFLRGAKQSLQLQPGREQEAGDNLTALDMQEGNGGIYRVSGLAQGKYEIFADESGRRMVRNNFSNLCVQDAGEMKILNERTLPVKPLSEFISEIKEILEE